MSALVERIIALRDVFRRLDPCAPAGDCFPGDPRAVLADAANAIEDRDADIHALRQRLERFEGLSAVEFYNCAVYVGEAKSAIEGADRGRELARMIRNLWDRGADL